MFNGTVGAGKTSVAAAAGNVLAGERIPHAVIDLDVLGQMWPGPRANCPVAGRWSVITGQEMALRSTAQIRIGLRCRCVIVIQAARPWNRLRAVDVRRHWEHQSLGA